MNGLPGPRTAARAPNQKRVLIGSRSSRARCDAHIGLRRLGFLRHGRGLLRSVRQFSDDGGSAVVSRHARGRQTAAATRKPADRDRNQVRAPVRLGRWPRPTWPPAISTRWCRWSSAVSLLCRHYGGDSPIPNAAIWARTSAVGNSARDCDAPSRVIHISEAGGPAPALRIQARCACSSPPAVHGASRSQAIPWCC